MAGSAVAPVNYYQAAIDGAQSTQDLIIQRQQAAMDMQLFQQKQQAQQRQQAAQQVYGQYLASIGAGQSQIQQIPGQIPSPPTVQTPQPGQSSQPMQQPGQSQGQSAGMGVGNQLPPPPGQSPQGMQQQPGQMQGPTQGQSAGMGVGNQLPPPPIQQAYAAGLRAGVQHASRQFAQSPARQAGGMTGQPSGGSPAQSPAGSPAQPGGGLPPFRSMPSAPPQQPQQPAGLIPPPPSPSTDQQSQSSAPGQLTLQGAIQWMDKNNIAPEDRPAALAQMMPALNYQAKQQLAMAQEQDRQAREQETTAYHRASLDARADTSAAGGWTLLTDASGKNYRLNTRTGEAVPVELGGAPAAGATRTGAKFTPGVGAGDVADYGKPLPNTAWETNAQTIAEGRAAPIPLSSRAKGAQETMARVMQINPDYDAKDYGTKAVAEKYWATGKGGQQVNSVNTAFSHLGNLEQAGQQLKNGGTPAWNAFANRVATEAGLPAPTNFDAQKEVVSDEVVKAMVGAGGGTLDDREAIKSIFSNAKSPAQMQGAMESVRKLMAGKLGAMERQYSKSTGRNDFRDYLSPEAASYLPSDSGGGAGGTSKAPAVGFVKGGYRFTGGDPSQESSWEKM